MYGKDLQTLDYTLEALVARASYIIDMADTTVATPMDLNVVIELLLCMFFECKNMNDNYFFQESCILFY